MRLLVGKIGMVAFVLALLYGGSFGVVGAQSQTVIVYGHWGSPAVEQPVVDLFEAAHPDIKIELLSLGGGTIATAEKLLVMAAGGVLPDMFSLSGTQGVPPIFLDAGLLLDLTSYMERDGVREEDFVPNAWNYAKKDGRIWGWPRATYGISLGTAIIAYNRNMYDSAGLPYPTPGWTYEDFTNNGKKMTIDKTGNGVMDQWGSQQLGRNWWQVWVWSNGGEVLTEDMTDIRLLEPEAVEGIQWLGDLIHVHQVAPDKSSAGNLERGTAAMAQVPLSAYRSLQGVPFDWGLTVPPVGPSGTSGYSLGGSNIIGVASTTEHPEAVWTFLKFLADEDVHAKEVFEFQTATPNLRNVALSDRFLYHDGPPYDMSPIVFNNPAKPTPQFAKWPDFNAAVEDIIRNQVLTGSQDAQTALEQSASHLRSILGDN